MGAFYRSGGFKTSNLCRLFKRSTQGGDNTKVYTMTNLVYHLKSKHLEEYKKYKELCSDEQQGSSTKGKGSKEAHLKQLTLEEAE